MENTDFDNKIKTALEEIEVKMPASAWHKMEQKYEASITEELPEAVAEVDKVVIRKLHNMEVAYRNEYWGRMENLLVVNKLIIRKIWVTKISELAIASLLLLGWYDATFSTQAQFPKYRQVKPTTTEPIASTQKPSIKKNAASPVVYNLDNKVNGNGNGNEKNGNIFSDITHSIAQIFDWQLGETPDTGHEQSEDVALTLSNAQQNAPRGQVQNTTNPIDIAKHWLIAPLDYGNMPYLDTKKHSLADQYLPIQPQKTPIQWYLGVYSGVANTQISAPMLYAESNDAFIAFASSPTGGVVVGARKGNWYLETGIGYSNTKFTPQKQTEIYAGNINEGYLGNQLVNTQYQQIHVPVAIGRKIWHKNRTDLSLKAGVSGNFVANAKHQYNTVYYPGAAPDQGNNTTSSGQRSPQYIQKGKGLLQGGSTIDNLYLTADVAIRAEYALYQKRTKLFAELAHHSNILGTGVGSFEDKLSMTSLRLGVIAAL